MGCKIHKAPEHRTKNIGKEFKEKYAPSIEAFEKNELK